MNNFERALPLVLKHEGGLVEHPKDPGGRTNRGITQMRYDEWRKKQKLEPQAVDHITDDEVRAIYREYWDAIKGDDLPAGLDYAAFDFAVHSGPAAARRFLALSNDSIERLTNLREQYLKNMPHWTHFARGWQRRVNEVKRTALEWAREAGEAGAADAPWMEIARGDLGIAEIPGPTHNEFIIQMWKSLKLPFRDDETHWCMGYAMYVLQRAGMQHLRTAWARDGLKLGQPIDKPRYGCLVILRRGEKGGHIGFYERESETHVWLLGGNQGNAVTIAPFPKSRVLGYRWPLPADPEVAAGEEWISAPSSRPEYDPRMERVQRRLRQLGYCVGEIDGQHGPNTARGIAAFQMDHRLEGNPGWWYSRYDDVLRTARPVVPERRARTQPRDLVKVDPTARKLSWIEQILLALGLSSGGMASLPQMATEVQGAFAPIAGLVNFIAANKVFFIPVMFILAALLIRYALAKMAEAYRTNSYQGDLSKGEDHDETVDVDRIVEAAGEPAIVG